VTRSLWKYLRYVSPIRENEIEAEIWQRTRAFRESSEQYWSDLRALLQAKGIEPETSWIADKWPDEDSDFLLIVTPRGTAFEVGYHDTLPEKRRYQASLGLWTEVVPDTSEWQLYRDRLERARAIQQQAK
jgi:hypothetical protein